MMPDNTPQEEQPGLREQVGVALSGVRASALHAAEHLEALAALFREELAEYERKQTCRFIWLSVGAVLLGCAYFLLCTLAVLLIQPLVCSFLVAVALVLAFNLAAGLVVLWISRRCMPDGIAPNTVQELKTDWEWIERSLKGKE